MSEKELKGIVTNLYNETIQLDPEDLYRQAERTKSENKRQFFLMLGDYITQVIQRKLIKENVF